MVKVRVRVSVVVMVMVDVIVITTLLCQCFCRELGEHHIWKHRSCYYRVMKVTFTVQSLPPVDSFLRQLDLIDLYVCFCLLMLSHSCVVYQCKCYF